jgi:hypothetical protein
MEIVEKLWAWLKSIWNKIAEHISLGGELIWVLLGGAFGGAMAPALSMFLGDKLPGIEAPELWFWFQHGTTHMALGAIAAGVTVYVVSKRDKDPAKSLFFFSVICGFTFQSILTGLTQTDETGQKAQATSELGVNSAQVSTKVESQIQAMAEAPAASAALVTKAIVQENAKVVVEQLQTKQANATDAAEKQELKDAIADIGATAERLGYSEVADAAAVDKTPSAK